MTTPPKEYDDRIPANVYEISFWGNTTPEGFPRQLARWVYTAKEHAERTNTCEEQRTLRDVCTLFGITANLTSSMYPKPIPQRPAATLARMRRNRLQKRMTKRWPLFAEQLIEEELAKKPDYYAGLSPYDTWRTNYNRDLAQQTIEDTAAIAKRKEPRP